ncbi:hypothetical protein TWF481_011645 [Arthrobotrys musiformis]|uniref:PA14 domain-containing protein n=1 Tax=Arthrobotrys musiformis TaxID=47236 RepID=A0AAV9VYX3_9PEZI
MHLSRLLPGFLLALAATGASASLIHPENRRELEERNYCPPAYTITKYSTKTTINTSTKTSTKTITKTSTYTKTVTVSKTKTLPATTITKTLPIKTITQTGPTQTVTKTLPVVTSTVTNTETPPTETVTNTETLPADTVTNTETLPAETVTNTETLPAETVTATLPAETVTATLPAETVIETPPTKTLTETATLPAETVTETPPAETVTKTETATETPPPETITETVTNTENLPAETVTATTTIIIKPSDVPDTSCNNGGLDVAIYDCPYREGSGFGIADVDYTYFKTKTPYNTTVTDILGIETAVNGTSPHDFIVHDTAANTYAISYRSFIYAPKTGVYKFSIPYVDNLLGMWIGDKALSGWSNSNADADPHLGVGSGTATFERSFTAGEYVPFRMMWLNTGGPGGYDFDVTDPAGDEVYVQNRVASLLWVRTSCDPSITLPQFPPYGNEP